jgi:hypothetical protein
MEVPKSKFGCKALETPIGPSLTNYYRLQPFVVDVCGEASLSIWLTGFPFGEREEAPFFVDRGPGRRVDVSLVGSPVVNLPVFLRK